MIWLNFGKWSYSKIYKFLGYYTMSTRYYHKGKWTPIVFVKIMNVEGINWSEIKEVCTSLDNVFYGAMAVAAVGLLVWFWMLMGIYLIVAPVAYVLLCYLGQYIKKHFKDDKGLRKVVSD